VERPGDLPFTILQELVDEVVTVEEGALAEGMRLLAQRAKLVAEAAGAAALAAALSGATPVAGRTVVLILSGGNVDLDRLSVIFGGRNGPVTAP
jgi:threonine dehydratase